MEVAGLVLGALPIAILAIEKHLKPFERYKKYPEILKEIRRNLFIQEQQLQVTLESIGLSKPTLQDVQQRLHEIKPDCSGRFIDVLEHMGKITSRLMDKLEIDSNGKPKWTDEAPERVSWEWRRVKRSFGDRERKELFDELHRWNTALKNCLEPKREILSDHADPVTAELVRRFDLGSCDKARENVRIFHEALAAAWGNCTDHQHPSNVGLTWQRTGLKETGQLQLLVPEIGGNGEDKHWQKIMISIDTTRINSTSSFNAAPKLIPAANLASDSTLVMPKERKWISTDWFRGLFPLNLKAGKPSAVSGMQEASPQPDCLGSNQNCLPNTQLITELCDLMKQEEWNGHLLHTDMTDEKAISMRRVLCPCSRFSSLSLEAVLSNHACRSGRDREVAYVRLSRKERFGIAAAAVWAVLVLCGTPWLEERWLRKEDISLLVEVPAQGNGFDRPKTYPSLSHIFTSQQETSSKLLRSQSPNGYQECQIRHKTLFALGILLIELGLNKPFHQIRANTDTGGPTCETSVQDDYIIAKQVIDSEELELEIGESYANAVQRCIQCHFLGRESTQNFLHSGFRKQFFTGVVAPVQATFDAQITSVHSL
ncbi:hypothetical protein F5B21DRAFT_7760 [Xylaria acuta]|nr:hypothetical protein F5B21DRAFT_7760 [Xylaria acuta]